MGDMRVESDEIADEFACVDAWRLGDFQKFARGTLSETRAELDRDWHLIDTRAIQDWLGHVSITHTTRYTQLSQTRFKDFWR